MSKQIQSTNKKSNKNIFFVVEGEFDMTKLHELPFGIVDYCLSFLTARDKDTGLPSLWFQRLAFEELKNVWETKIAPDMRKRLAKKTQKQLSELTRGCGQTRYWNFVLYCDRKKEWIERVTQFPPLYNFYNNQKVSCIERILMSKGLRPLNKNRAWSEIDPFATAKITLKDLRFKEVGERQAYCVGCGEEIDFSNKYWCSRGDRYWCVDCDLDDN